MEIQKGMYGLPQYFNISNNIMKKHLAKLGCDPAPITPVLWCYQTWPLRFSFLVNYFGIRYENQLDKTHLLDALATIYKIS